MHKSDKYFSGIFDTVSRYIMLMSSFNSFENLDILDPKNRNFGQKVIFLAFFGENFQK